MGLLRLLAAAALAASGSFFTTAAGAPTPRAIPLVIQSGTIPISAEVAADVPNVQSALAALNISTDHALIIPPLETPLRPELRITLLQEHTVNLLDGGQPVRSFTTFATTVSGAMQNAGVTLASTDRVDPELTAPVNENSMVVVTRVREQEEQQTVSIPFGVHTHNDATLPWGEDRVLQAGHPGVAEETVRVTLENGVVVHRTVLSRRVLQESAPEERSHGTLVRIGKVLQGKGSWYSYRKGNYAAATAFPRGSWLRVTNLENGRTIIVQVNDYGPFVPGRIIDLETTAFRQLAATGQGVIPVQVEQILQ